MTESSCEMCGKLAVPTALGTVLCAVCSRRYGEFLCRGCGQRVLYLHESLKWAPWLASEVCSTCRIRERLAGIPEADREAIRAATGRGTIAGIKEARERLGWSIHEAVLAVELLRNWG